MKYLGNNVKYHPKITQDKIFDEYRWGIENKFLWEKLNSLGVIPQKSKILTFPNLSIFKEESLIRDFIRGYWDGDGCIDRVGRISVLGTKNFLTKLSEFLPKEYKYSINKIKDKELYQITADCKKAYTIIKYLYKDSNIYLDRKYEKYLEICRLREKSCKLLETQNGEVCDDNTVLI